MIKQTYLTLCILLVACLTACKDFEDPVGKSSVLDGNKIEVSIKTGVPALTVQTKADATGAENQLDYVDVLVFEVDKEDPEKEIFAYRTKNSNTLAEPINNEVEIKVKLNLSEDNEKYRLVFIANLQEDVDRFFSDSEEAYKGTTKKELLEELIFIQEEIWTDDETDSRPLPMWGESSASAAVTKEMSPSAFGYLKLMRSIARIELSVSLSDNNQPTNGAEQFEIKSVRVYNARERGLAAPAPDHIEDGEAINPTLVSGSGLITDASKSKYIVPSEAENKVTGIYINEASNHVNDGEEVFLVVGAIYKKENASNDKVTYYKIGFYDIDDEPVDILRNFTYNMIITGVSGEGEDSEEEAVGSTTSNLTVSMTEWSGGEMKYVVFGGKYYLAVSDAMLTVPKSAGTYELKVKTNYPTGWKAVVSKGSWITGLSPVSGSKDVGETVTFNVTENDTENDTSDERTGIISFSCGENYLSLDVYVTQTDEETFSIKIQVYDSESDAYVDLDNNTLLFHSGNRYEIEPRDVKIIWTPVSEDLIIDFDRSFEWDATTQLQTIYTGGEIDLKIAPARMLTRPVDDPDPLRAWFPSEEVELKIQVGGDSSTKQTVSVKKQHYEIYIDRSERYKLDGEKHSFKIYSNSPEWEISFLDKGGIGEYINGGEPISVIKGGVTIGNDIDDSSESIEFILNEPPEGSSINAEVAIQVTYDDFGEKFVKTYIFWAYYEDSKSEYIAGGDANCYLLKPEGLPIRIPVSQANRAEPWLGKKMIEDNDILTPYFIWTDHPGGYKGGKNNLTEYTISDYKVIGEGPTAILEVTPGNAAGNAVIGIKNQRDETVWSWHLWVSDFDPDTDVHEGSDQFRYYQFMDRNLGALTATPGTQKSLGLYYQWGRKDPFPSASGVGETNFADIFDEDGEPTSMKKISRPTTSGWGSKQHHIEQSIDEPLTFITNSDTWISGDVTLASSMTQLWNENETSDLSNAKKGVFDPCPDGWKTVPGTLSANNAWYGLFRYSSYNSATNHSSVHNPAYFDLGIWPHAGYIYGGSGTIVNAQEGRYWTGNKDMTSSESYYAYHFQFRGSSDHPGLVLQSSNALSVRCMRRTDQMR